MDKEDNLENWPLSNYPIFLALILLVATAATLSMEDEHKAENFAIYAYYFLVIGVAIRFLEFTLPGNILSRAINGTKNFLKECRKIEQYMRKY